MDMLEPTQKIKITNSRWIFRRRFMFAVSLFCAIVILWIIEKGADTVVNQTAVTMAFATLISITGSYVFGAVWDDKHT